MLTENVNLILVDPLYSTRRTRGQPDRAHDVFSKRDTTGAVRVLGKVMAPGADGRTICSKLMLHDWNRCLCADNEKVEDMEGDLEKEKVPDVLEMEGQAALYANSPTV